MTSPIHTTARLADLTLHRFNPRQTHDPDDIAALAKSIVINGLMQNLNVFNEDGQLGVVAGGRRLRALEYLRDHGTDIEGGIQIDFDAIPARITTDPALAHKWAGSEGATQRPLHPAEEIRAYAAMAEQGNGADIIAMAYGQTETHVKRRLKLARLSDAALDALRDNKITLDVAKVLTLTDSPQREMAMLELAADRNYSPARLRQELTEGKVTATDRRVKYITLLLYLAEGGAMDEDLFSDASLLHDRDLIDSLFKIKLTKAAEDIKSAEGVAQVVPLMDAYMTWDQTHDMTRLHRTPVDLPEADDARYDELSEIGETREFTDAEADEYDALQQRMQGDYSDEDRAAATLFIYVDHDGRLQTSDAYKPRANGTATGSDSDGTATKSTPKPPITQGGLDDLRKIELAALQTRMMSQPELALDLLTFQLWHEFPSFSGPFNIRAEDQNCIPSTTDGVSIDKRITGDDDTVEPLDHDIGAAFDAFLAKGKKHRNTLLAMLLARTMNTPFASRANQELMSRLDVNPRKVWTPTAENFFKACRSETMDAIWRKLALPDFGDKDDAAEMKRFSSLKVGKKRDELEALFNDASTQEALGLNRDQVAAIDAWLPDELLREQA